MKELTVERLKELLDYDPETGVFTWKKKHGTRSGKAGGLNSEGYRKVQIDGRKYGAGRLAWFFMLGRWPAHEVDHVNGERGDDRWSNLREATHQQNACNRGRRVDNSSGVTGVSLCKVSGLWVAYVAEKGKIVRVGRFATKQEAVRAREKEAVLRYGEFSRRSE